MVHGDAAHMGVSTPLVQLCQLLQKRHSNLHGSLRRQLAAVECEQLIQWSAYITHDEHSE
jgi:hypothetical protein